VAEFLPSLRCELSGSTNGSLGSRAIRVVSHSAGIQFIGVETMRTLALAYNVTLI
jgi:hypothetical protein